MQPLCQALTELIAMGFSSWLKERSKIIQPLVLAVTLKQGDFIKLQAYKPLRINALAYIREDRSLRLLVTTLTELSAMAAPAIIGLSKKPFTG